MKQNRKLLRNIGFVTLILVAIGAIGYAATGSDDGITQTARDESAANINDLGLSAVEPGFGDDSLRQGAGSDGAIGAAPFPSGDVDVDESAPTFGEAEAAPAPGEAVAGGGSLAQGLDRKIVQTASMQLQVDEVGVSFEEVGRIATSVGGFVASSSFSYVDESQIASVTIRVPAESYQSVLSSLRNLAVKVDVENSDSRDVTEEFTDLSSRLRNLEATETQLLALLEQAETVTDILTVQDRLNDVRSQIEQVRGRLQLLEDLTDLATVTAHLRPVAAAGAGTGNGVDLGTEIADAWDESIAFLEEVAGGVLTVVVFVWWVPVVSLPVLVAYKLATRNRPGPIEAVD